MDNILNFIPNQCSQAQLDKLEAFAGSRMKKKYPVQTFNEIPTVDRLLQERSHPVNPSVIPSGIRCQDKIQKKGISQTKETSQKCLA